MANITSSNSNTDSDQDIFAFILSVKREHELKEETFKRLKH